MNYSQDTGKRDEQLDGLYANIGLRITYFKRIVKSRADKSVNDFSESCEVIVIAVNSPRFRLVNLAYLRVLNEYCLYQKILKTT
jgi:hypothetical protein